MVIVKIRPKQSHFKIFKIYAILFLITCRSRRIVSDEDRCNRVAGRRYCNRRTEEQKPELDDVRVRQWNRPVPWRQVHHQGSIRSKRILLRRLARLIKVSC